MARASQTQSPLLPQFDDALSGYIAKGNIDAVRGHFDSVFWNNDTSRPGWDHLKLALLREDLPMLKLLIVWGARAGETDLKSIEKLDAKKYPEYLKLLRRAGHNVSVEALSESSAKAEALPPRNESLDDTVIRAFVDDHFIDHRAGKLPKEWRTVLHSIQETGAPEAIIGGGALRDLFNKRAIKDVDIFLQSRGSERKNKKFLQAAFKASKLPVVEQAVYSGGYSDGREAFPSPKKTTLQEKAHRGYGEIRPASNSEAWTIIAGANRTEYNVIFVDGPLGAAMARATENATSATRPMVSVFDFGLCQIGFDGQEIYTTAKYRNDVQKQEINLDRDNGTTRQHLERLVKKYPDWKLCPASEKILNPPPAPKPAPRRSSGYGGGWSY